MATGVFADLVGSTSLYERLGDAAASAFVSQLTASLCRCFESHSGRVVKLLGDGLFVLFASEKDALAACVAVQQNLHEKPVFPSATHHAAAQMQFGMESGDVVEIDGDCFGDAVNSAARLADLAGGGQILTTARVRSALPGALKSLLHSLGPLFLRGKTDATEVFRVQWRVEPDNDVTIMGTSKAASLNTEAGLPAAKSRLSLRMETPNAQSLQLDAPHGSALIGRALPSAQELGATQVLLVNDSRVSRLHCKHHMVGHALGLGRRIEIWHVGIRGLAVQCHHPAPWRMPIGRLRQHKLGRRTRGASAGGALPIPLSSGVS